MYKRIKDYLMDTCSNTDLLVSAISARNVSFEVGLPCILNLGAKHIKYKKSKSDARDEIVDIMKSGKHTINALNEYFYNNHNTVVEVIYPFPSRNDMGIVYLESRSGFDFHCIKSPPILTDKYKSAKVKNFKNVSSSEYINKFPDKIEAELKKYRYSNYVLEEVGKSNYKDIIQYLYNLYGVLNNKYPHNTCAFSMGNGELTLLDTMSISFYKLTDVIPIFDTKHANGIAVEILFTNSTLEKDDLFNGGNHLIVRWLMSKYRDNLFTIDGEQIKRSFQKGIPDIIEGVITSILSRYVPDDTALKKKKAAKGG